MKIVWSNIAEADLDDLYDYIARDVPYYAEQFTSRLIDAVATLTDHPNIGRHVPEAEERNDIRELLFQNYRIIYLVGSNQVFVLTIIHGSRNLAGQVPKPWEVV